MELSAKLGYRVRIEDHFSAAHQLREYGGKCERLHGHNWRVLVEVASDTLDALGFVVDFKDLKAMLRECLSQLDHCFLNELPLFKATNPTAERISRYVWEQIDIMLRSRVKDAAQRNVRLTKVEVYESDSARATCLLIED